MVPLTHWLLVCFWDGFLNTRYRCAERCRAPQRSVRVGRRDIKYLEVSLDCQTLRS